MAVKRIATSQPSASAIDTLNTREREILELIAEGMTNRQIGETLALAESLAVFSSPSVLIAVGTRHSTGRRPRRNWSVGARVAGAAEGPVTIIPHPLVGDGNSIVVGVDDPEESASLFAAEEAARTGATLRPVRAWEGPPLWPGRTEHDPAYLESLAEMYRNLVTDAMESILMRYPNLMVNPVVERGIPADVLLEAPKGAWTLVVGNRGFHGLKRFFLGSVSQTVVLQAAVPTVVVNASSAR
ncbi:universal stress protein [Mycetocola miduiensis]|nr:universal stress protein [Mycetocola miduiensis]